MSSLKVVLLLKLPNINKWRMCKLSLTAILHLCEVQEDSKILGIMLIY